MIGARSAVHKYVFKIGAYSECIPSMIINCFVRTVHHRIEYYSHIMSPCRIYYKSHHSAACTFLFKTVDVTAEEKFVLNKGSSLQSRNAMIFCDKNFFRYSIFCIKMTNLENITVECGV